MIRQSWISVGGSKLMVCLLWSSAHNSGPFSDAWAWFKLALLAPGDFLGGQLYFGRLPAVFQDLSVCLSVCTTSESHPCLSYWIVSTIGSSTARSGLAFSYEFKTIGYACFWRCHDLKHTELHRGYDESEISLLIGEAGSPFSLDFFITSELLSF